FPVPLIADSGHVVLAKLLILIHICQRHVFRISGLPVGAARAVGRVGDDTGRRGVAAGVNKNEPAIIEARITSLEYSLIHLVELALYERQGLCVIECADLLGS